MADSKITALTAISTVDPTADPLVIVDVSDTSMAASGTTKKSTINQLLGAGGTATLASATITGDLTVDTSTLKVDSANNRVGIGTATPGYNLQVGSATYASIGTSIDSITQTSHIFKGTPDAVGYEYAKILSGRESSPFTYGSFLAFYTEGKNSGTTDTSTERYKIDSTGVATWSNVGGVAGTAMTLNATGLGVGVGPAANTRLSIRTAATTDKAFGSDNGVNADFVIQYASGLTTIGSELNAPLAFKTNNVERMRIDTSGNVGIGVTPITSHILSCAGPVGITGTLAGSRTSYITNSSAASIYYTDGGGSGFFTDFGNLIIQPRTSAARSVVIATGSTTPVERAVVKSTGQVRFVPLASDPAGAETGDVYYNSTSNKLKCYNGTTWNDLF